MIGFIIGYLSGFATVLTIGAIINHNDKKKSLLKRGIYECSYTINIRQIDVQFEVVEIERTKDKSKVEVLSIITSEDTTIKFKLKNLVNNSWILTSKIEWIEKPINDIRDDKINEILK